MAVLVGLDVGQMADFTALAVLEYVHEVTRVYTVGHLQRFDLRTPYPVIVERVAGMLQRPEVGSDVTLLIDVTGVGRGVLDMFHVAHVVPIAVSIHGGSAVTHQGREWHVPKKDLVYSLTALSQARPVRLALGERVPFAREVRQEMQSFTAKINHETAHESFAAWREQLHDDLILAMSLCTWWGERRGERAGAWGR